MSLVFEGDLVRMNDFVGVEEAEGLLEWLQAHPRGAIDLSGLQHMHAANLQVLMAAKAPIAAWPADEQLANWLKTSLQQGE